MKDLIEAAVGAQERGEKEKASIILRRALECFLQVDPPPEPKAPSETQELSIIHSTDQSDSWDRKGLHNIVRNALNTDLEDSQALDSVEALLYRFADVSVLPFALIGRILDSSTLHLLYSMLTSL